MTPTRGQLPDCPIIAPGGECLPECRVAGACRAGTLLLVDGRVFRGRVLGVIGDTLRYQSVHPIRGPVLLAFTEVEPLSLHDALRGIPVPLDCGSLLRLAEAAAARGLVDLALRDLERASGVAGEGAEGVGPCRERILRQAGSRALEEARDHLAARRFDHARAALDEVLRRFPESESAREARRLRRSLVGGSA